ncbi:SEL1-like repeat protein [Permianibacter aggregans]|uniref:TPR repeat protein n=1 Tax=Permianibacter aggregans TaxID=1510150 RepID=A0A4R6UNQ9_9GAMM|nr:SEL1-like repeat protein [Permianibacter aggregans]QGX39755.1 hypothetical protein E2H98_08840 [Permianibacter aggregans]TDQ47123.1 TPR repeat protein [Permianibacter aggregans]
MKKSIVSTVFVLALTACAGRNAMNPDQRFNEMADRIMKQQQVPLYQAAWNAYLRSSQVSQSNAQHEAYLRALDQIQKGELSCDQVNWSILTRQNFWALKPHLSASACYQEKGKLALAQQHDAAVEFILNGILRSGDGEDVNSAYEVASLGDADDLIEFMGLRVIDSYGEFHAARQGLYYVVVAEDLETGQQKEIYLNNQRFIHAVVGAQYPFLGTFDGWNTKVLPELAEYGKYMKVPLGDAAFADGKTDEGFKHYMAAIAEGSHRARVRLAVQCLRKNLPQLSNDQCVQILVEAVEAQYVPAIILLAFAYESGFGVEKDVALSRELLASIGNRKPPGYSEFAMYKYWGDESIGKKNDAVANAYLSKSEAMGFPEAKLVALLLRMGKSPKDWETHLTELKKLGEDGKEVAAYLVGEFLYETNQKGTEEFNESEVWFKKAAEKGHPASFNVLGRAAQRGEYRAVNIQDANYYFTEAAIRFNPNSMLSLGYHAENGRGVVKDYAQAFNWYAMCHAQGNEICSHNLGRLFHYGFGVKVDYAIAFKLYMESAEKNYPKAFNGLGILYRDGEGVEKNIGKAIEYFQKAADRNDVYANYNLGVLFLLGRDVPRDLDKAKKYLLNAEGHPFVDVRLRELASIISVAEPEQSK